MRLLSLLESKVPAHDVIVAQDEEGNPLQGEAAEDCMQLVRPAGWSAYWVACDNDDGQVFLLTECPVDFELASSILLSNDIEASSITEA